MVGLEAATLLLRSSTPGSHKKNPLAVSPFEDVPACGNGAAQPGGCGSGRRPRLRCRPWVRPGFGGFLGLASRVLLCMTIPLGRSFPSRPSFFLLQNTYGVYYIHFYMLFQICRRKQECMTQIQNHPRALLASHQCKEIRFFMQETDQWRHLPWGRCMPSFSWWAPIAQCHI